MSDDLRQFHRVALGGTVHLVGNTYSGPAELLDLSLKGALVRAPTGWCGHLGEAFELAIRLEGADAQVCMQATVAHQEGSHVGFSCHHIDLDSISFLRRLVELNLGDPAMLERELSALGEVRHT